MNKTPTTSVPPAVQNLEARAALEHQLNDLMKDFRVAMLVTQEFAPSGNGQTSRALHSELRARPMAVAEVSDNNTICFSTSMNTAKIEEIRAHAEVLVTMQSEFRYISVGGRCVLSQDPADIARLWNESWRVWFPKGKEDPELVLLRVPVQTGEFWDLQGTKGMRFLWQATLAYFRGEKVAEVADSHGTLAPHALTPHG